MKKRSNLWSPQATMWLDSVRVQAWDSADNVTAQAQAYVVALQWAKTSEPDLERRALAQAEYDTIVHNGAVPILVRWNRTRGGLVAVPVGKRQVTKSRIGGRRARTDKGAAVYQQGLFELMTFAQLRQVLADLQTTIDGYGVRRVQIRRLLDLQEKARLGDDATPAQAAALLGTTPQEWIERAS